MQLLVWVASLLGLQLGAQESWSRWQFAGAAAGNLLGLSQAAGWGGVRELCRVAEKPWRGN